MRIPTQSDFGSPGVLNRHGRRHAPHMGDDSMRDSKGAFSRSQCIVETADDGRVDQNLRLVAAAILLTIGVIWALTSLL